MSVPVLSELIAEVEPSVSVDGKRFMFASALASCSVPQARMVLTARGSATGIAAMAKATAALKTAMNVPPRARFSAIDATSAMPAMLKGSKAYVAAARLRMHVCAGNGFSTDSVMSFRHWESIVATISGGSSRSSATASCAQHGPAELPRQPHAAAD